MRLPKRSVLSGSAICAMLMVLLPISNPANAQECTPPAMLLDERPDAAAGATQVSIGVALVDLRQISDPDQSVTVNLLATMGWRDPRLADLAGCQVNSAEIWDPRIEILNSGSSTIRGGDVVTIAEGGEVRRQLRIEGVFTTPLDISDFPFDQQVLRLRAMSLRYPVAELQLQVDESWTGQRDGLTIPDWDIGTVTASVKTQEIPQLGRSYSRYEMAIPAQRQHGFFVYKLILPLCMIVIMSWALFWIHPGQVAPRMGVAVTSMLTLIAFQFSISSLLPRVSYFTLLDRFILGASVLIFLALVEAVGTSYLAMEERKQLGRRINRVARIAFPLVFVALVIWVFLLS